MLPVYEALVGADVATIYPDFINTSNRQAHYFHQMNIIWNSFNLTLATLSYVSATKEKTDHLNLTNVLGHQNKTAKLFLFNAGLDVAYVTGGFY